VKHQHNNYNQADRLVQGVIWMTAGFTSVILVQGGVAGILFACALLLALHNNLD